MTNAALHETMRQTRLLLDSNIWRYFTDSDRIGALIRMSNRRGYRVLIAPTVLYEAMRIRDPILRRKLCTVMTDPHFTRLMPDAYYEAREFIGEVRRCRPEWVRLVPQLEKFRKFKHDWTRSRGGFWDRARKHTSYEAEALALLEGDMLCVARSDSKAIRNHRLDNPASWLERARLDQLRLIENGEHGSGSLLAVEPWRRMGCRVFRQSLRDSAHPYFTWCAGELNLEAMLLDESAFDEFWHQEIKATAMPRAWLRYAIEHWQQFQKSTEGSPCDTQLAVHMIDADVFISADRRLVNIIERCRREAPFNLAKPFAVPGGAQDCPPCVLEALRSGRW